MMVKFATTCDRCQTRSEEYTAWPSCRECGEHICDACGDPATVSEPDVDAPAKVTCYACQAADAEVTPSLKAGEFEVRLDGRFVGVVTRGKSPERYWYADQQKDWANQSLNGAHSRDRAVAWLVDRANADTRAMAAKSA